MSNVERAVSALGIHITDDYTDELWALCPQHKARTGKDDHNPSWSINRETGQHMCFSCGYKGGLLLLVADVKGFRKVWGASDIPDFEEAKRWLLTAAAMTPEDMAAAVVKASERATYDPPVPMSEARLAVFVEPTEDALQRRRLTAEACSQYEVLWDAKKQWWITPLRSADDWKLIGWQEKGEYDRYFKNRPPTMKKSKTLFGLHMPDVVDESGESPIIVVESPLDAVRVYAATGEAAVATCGAYVSEEQVGLLRSARPIIWAMDNPMVDPAGRKASAALLDLGRRLGVTTAKFFNYEGLTCKDPGEMSDAEIKDSIDNAIPAVYGKKAYLYL